MLFDCRWDQLYRIERARNINGYIDKNKKRIFELIRLDLNNKLDVLIWLEKTHFRITSNMKFNIPMNENKRHRFEEEENEIVFLK